MEIIGLFVIICLASIFFGAKKPTNENCTYEDYSKYYTFEKTSNLIKNTLEIKKVIGSKFHGLYYNVNDKIVEDPRELFVKLDDLKLRLYNELSAKEQINIMAPFPVKKEITKYVFSKIDILEYLMNKYLETQEIFGKKCYLVEMYTDFKVLSSEPASNDFERILAIENRLNFTIVIVELYNDGLNLSKDLYNEMKLSQNFEKEVMDILRENPQQDIGILFSILYFLNKEYLQHYLEKSSNRDIKLDSALTKNYKTILLILMNYSKEISREILDKINMIYSRDKKYFR